MFDDPRKNLKQLEEQLLSETEAPGSETGDDPLGDESWLDDELREAHALMNNDYTRAPSREPVIFNYDVDTEEEDDLAVYSDAPAAPRRKKGKKSKKEKGIGGLVFLACLETLGIIAVLLWWVLWLL